MKTIFYSLTIISLCLIHPVYAQTNNYFGGAGALNGNVWNVLPAGPYTLPLNTAGGAILNFNNPCTVTGATVTVAGINAGSTVSAWTNTGTLSTGGTVIPINVSGGAVLNMNQDISTSTGTGINKTGGGTLLLSGGSLYDGGFTLSAGTMVVGGVNAMGNNTLRLDGGILCSDANRNLAGKYPGGIAIGGNIQFGEVTAPAAPSANLTLGDNINLGAVNRTLTLGNAGTVALSGLISNTAPAGISFTANINGTGFFDVTHTGNTFSGPVNISGGEVRFAANGSCGNPANVIVIDGGQLRSDAIFTLAHPVQLGTNAGTAINVASANLTISGVVSGTAPAVGLTKKGAGILTLTSANTYTGTTYVSAAGGTLQLKRPGGNTLPVTNDVEVNGGVLQISSNQVINNLTLRAGNLAVDNGVTLTINGTLDYFQPASITLTGTGKIAYGAAGTLQYSGSVTKTASAPEWPATNVPNTVVCNNSSGVNLPIKGTVTGTLALNAGTFTISAGGELDLNGASLLTAGGALSGNAAGDLTVRGAGATVIIPSAISLRNVTVDGTRVLALNGINNLNLYGTLLVGTDAVFDNGGESQLLNGGGSPAVNIDGKFINRDKDNFTGSNGAIPGITTTLNTGSTVEYGLAGNQLITKRDDYYNVTLSGGGIKTLANACAPAGTIFITGNTTVDAGIHVFGDLVTNLSMDNGRLILRGTTNPQPHMGGMYNLTGGVIQFDCNSASGQTIRSQTYKNIEVTGLYTGNSNGNITLDADGSFVVKTGSTFEMNDNAIVGPSGNQTITVEAGATFKCGNALGFNGPLQGLNSPAIRDNIETIVLQPNSTVNYSRSNPPQVSGNQTITNTMPYQHLILSGVSGIKTAPAGVLTIQGNFVKTGTPGFAHNNGTVLLNGANQQVAGLPYNNLLLDNGGIKTLMGNASIADSLSISNLTTTPSTELSLGENYLTLLSLPSKTARVGIIPANPGVKINYGTNGRFVVERYYPPRRAWRLITAPITGTGSNNTVFKSWQNWGLPTAQSGTFITGKNANPASNGLDVSPFNNHSLKTYNHTTQLLESVTDTKTALIAGSTGTADNTGFFIFVRGDRSTSNLFNPPFSNATTLRDTGKIMTRTQSFNFSAASPSGFCLVGNPYASPVLASQVVANATGINNGVLYAYDPYLNASQGGYITLAYSNLDNKWLTIPPSPVGKQDTVIQSGQAFFVQRVAPSATVTFTEQDKWPVSNSAIFRPADGKTSNGFSVGINLFVQSAGSLVLADGVLAEFGKGYDNRTDDNDLVKIKNEKENLGLQRGAAILAVERRDSLVAKDTLFVSLSNMVESDYALEISPQHTALGLVAKLQDNYTGKSTPLNLQTSTRHPFKINSDAASASSNRFRIIFEAPGKSLPVIFTMVAAEKHANSVELKWAVQNETGLVQCEIEKSPDGSHFFKLGETAVTGAANYSWQDNTLSPGRHYYRIKAIDHIGNPDYSRIVTIDWGKSGNNISVYPNPVTSGVCAIYLQNQPRGNYQLIILNQGGQKEYETMMYFNGGSGTIKFTMEKKLLAPGIKLLQCVGPGAKISNLFISIQ